MEMQFENEENEENMYYLDVNEEMEVEEPVLQQTEDEEEHVLRFMEESVNMSRQEDEMVEKNEQESTFKLCHTETDALVKNEIKQLILTKVSEETDAKVLNDMNFEMEEEITTLKTKTDKQLEKNKEMEEEVEIDKNRLLQSVDILLKTNEMVELLKENVAKIEDQFKECHMPEILDKSKKQYKNLEILNNSYIPKIDKQNEKIKEILATGAERNNLLRSELEHRRQMVNDLKKRHDEEKAINLAYDEEIEKNLNNKRKMEQKLVDFENTNQLKRTTAENELIKQEEEIRKLLDRKDKKTERFNNLTKQKVELQEQLKQYVQDIEEIKTNVAKIKDATVEKEKKLEELAETLKTTKARCDEDIQHLQDDYEKLCCDLEESTTNISSAVEINKKLQEESDSLKVSYLKICEDKLVWSDKMIKEQTNVRNLEREYLLKKLELDTERNKFEELQKQQKEFLTRSKVLDEEILKHKDERINDVSIAKTRCENLRTENDQHLLDLKKKKEYSLATSNYLSEKIGILQKEVAKREERNQKLLRELEEMKKLPEVPMKSGFKSPSTDKVVKTVKFNEVLSIKSATESSETSSQVVASEAQAETSFHEWLQDADNLFLSELTN